MRQLRPFRALPIKIQTHAKTELQKTISEHMVVLHKFWFTPTGNYQSAFYLHRRNLKGL